MLTSNIFMRSKTEMFSCIWNQNKKYNMNILILIPRTVDRLLYALGQEFIQKDPQHQNKRKIPSSNMDCVQEKNNHKVAKTKTAMKSNSTHFKINKKANITEHKKKGFLPLLVLNCVFAKNKLHSIDIFL